MHQHLLYLLLPHCSYCVGLLNGCLGTVGANGLGVLRTPHFAALITSTYGLVFPPAYMAPL